MYIPELPEIPGGGRKYSGNPTTLKALEEALGVEKYTQSAEMFEEKAVAAFAASKEASDKATEELESDSFSVLFNNAFSAIAMTVLPVNVLSVIQEKAKDPSSSKSPFDLVIESITDFILSCPDKYMYYIAKKNIRKWLRLRIEMMQEFQAYLNYMLTYRNPLTPSSEVDNDMAMIINTLKQAEQLLGQIAVLNPEDVRRLVTAGINLKEFARKFKSELDLKNFSLDLNSVDVSNEDVRYLVTRIRNMGEMVSGALKHIDSVLAFLDSIFIVRIKGVGEFFLDNTPRPEIIRAEWQIQTLTKYWEEMKKYLLYIAQILQQLAIKLPFRTYSLGASAVTLATGFGKLISKEGSISEKERIVEEYLEKASKDIYTPNTLLNLNTKISQAFGTILNFSKKYNNMSNAKIKKITRNITRVKSELLSKFITKISDKEDAYPKNRADMLIHAPLWYVELSAIKAGILAETSLQVLGGIGPAFAGAIEDMGGKLFGKNGKNPSMDLTNISESMKVAEEIYKGLTKRFVSLILLATAPTKAFEEESMRNLILKYSKDCVTVINGDYALMQRIDSFIEPDGYQLFEKALDELFNLLQSKLFILGDDALKVIDFIRSGQIMDLYGDAAAIIDEFDIDSLTSFLGVEELSVDDINYNPISPLYNKFLIPPSPKVDPNAEIKQVQATTEIISVTKEYVEENKK